MIKHLKQIWGLVLGIGLVGVILGLGNVENFAQPGNPPGGQTQCSALLQAALESTDSECSDTSRNQACYGHVLNLVSPRPDLIESLVFDAQGDKVNLQDVSSMELSPLDLLEEHWGVVLMQVQANLPDSLPGQNVTFILFGDVQIENAVGTPVEIEGELVAPSNIRIAPGATRPVLASLGAGAKIIVNGKAMNSAGELWVRVNHDPDEEIYGWILSDLVNVSLDDLPDVQPSDQAINPMQAFYFKTGLGAPQCIDAPADGMLIQTPNGAGKVDFKVNGMEIALGSTAYLTAPAGEATSCVYLIEGESDVEAAGDGVTVQPGERTCVPLDEDGIASGAPSEPEPYDAKFVSSVVAVLDLLPEDVELPGEKPTHTPTFTPTDTRVPVVISRTATPIPSPTTTPTDFIFPTSTPEKSATPMPTALPSCDSEVYNPPCLPVATFSYVIDPLVDDKLVRFFNNSYGGITSSTWNFGDGNTSNTDYPMHTYADYGCYTVRLRVDNPYGFDRVTVSVDVVEPTPTPPTAQFTHSTDGFDFLYQDTSIAGSSPITNWDWSFSDGTTASGVIGSHTFAAGTFDATLTVTDANGLSDSETVTVTFGACTFSTSVSTTLSVTRDSLDVPVTEYHVFLKNADCSLPGAPNGILTVTNPTASMSIQAGQHYDVLQVQPCAATVAGGIAGTVMIDFMVSDACP